MSPGTKYKVTYQVPTLHRVPREMVAVFIGTEKNGKQVEYVFSGRPEFGTTHLRTGYVLKSEQVAESVRCYHSRKVAS